MMCLGTGPLRKLFQALCRARLLEVDHVPEEVVADLLLQVLRPGGLDDRVQVLVLLLPGLATPLLLLPLRQPHFKHVRRFLGESCSATEAAVEDSSATMCHEAHILYERKQHGNIDCRTAL